MITIKKYPNRRLYNTSTSTYITLKEIQDLILDGERVEIVDSKTNANVTTATLLLHALDPEVIEALVPGFWMQDLMRMPSNESRLSAIQAPDDSEESSESETQEEKTLPKVAIIQPVDMIVAALEEDSESSDSDSEVTIVRAGKPPTEPVIANMDTSQPIEVQVSMDAWGVSGEIEDTEIPSFWSDILSDTSALEDVSDSEVVESSDEGLFDQPETVVVRHREPVMAVPEPIQPLTVSFQSDGVDDADVQLVASEDELVKNSEEALSKDGPDMSSEEMASSFSHPEEESLESKGGQENEDTGSPPVVRPSVNAVSESTTPVSSSDASLIPNATSKSEQMKARLAAMRSNLKR